MGFWKTQVPSNVQTWLLENPDASVRYLALRDLMDLSPADPDLLKTQTEAHSSGKIQEILAHMQPEGYWDQPGAGYLKKYFSSVWSLITLAQLGASVKADQRIEKACAYYLSQAVTENGQITANGAPSSMADCLQGNMCAAFLDLGFENKRLASCFDWLARSVTGEGVAPIGTKGTSLRYYAGKIGPDFRCGSNAKLPCAWGAVKGMLAFSKYPKGKLSPMMNQAIKRGIDFFFTVDPASARYPCGYAANPSHDWWKFGFPVFYITDLLQLAEALVNLGYGSDPRLQNTIAVIKNKQDPEGRWKLEFSYAGKIWNDFGEKKQPNPWVTIRALRVLKKIYEIQE
jgi:hypothetical protein